MTKRPKWKIRLPLGAQGAWGYRDATASTLDDARRVAERHHGWIGRARLMRCSDHSYAVMAPETRSPLAQHGWITWTTIRRIDDR